MKGNTGDWLAELKDRLDIVDVVSRYVQLNQKGGNFWGRCPFHNEKTASFAVNAERQAYHCFGCHESGDAIRFVEKMESVSFMDAVKILADRVGYTIPSQHKSGEELAKRKEKKDRLLRLMTDTARYYYANLKREGSEVARSYMERRGLTGQTATMFGIGVSLGFSDLPQYLLGKGYTHDEMKRAGVCAEKNGRVYDSLGGRLIFPIIDALGQVVAFGGRLLEKSDFAKYKNTSETEIFTKSNVLYALNLVKKFKQGNLSSIIVVEGYMDTISLYKAGFTNVVASMGTSLTEGQVGLIKRMTDKVYISYDGDSAGQRATMRGLDLLGENGLEVFVVELTDDKDPDDIVRTEGKEGYSKLLEKAIPLTEYKLKNIRKSYDLQDKSQKRKYVTSALAVLKKLPLATEREEYLKQLKAETGFTYESLKNDLQEGAEVKREEEKLVGETDFTSGEDKAARYILSRLLARESFAADAGDLSQLFENPLHRRIYEYVSGGDAVTAMSLAEMLEPKERQELENILSTGGELPDTDSRARYFEESLRMLELKSISIENSIMTEELKTCQDAQQRAELGRKITKNILRMQKLRMAK